MTTQVMFRMDEGLKKKLVKKAKSDGLTLSTVFNESAKAYLQGDIVLRMTTKEIFKDSVRKEIESALEDIKHGRNLSKAFDNVEEAIQYLKKL